MAYNSKKLEKNVKKDEWIQITSSSSSPVQMPLNKDFSDCYGESLPPLCSINTSFYLCGTLNTDLH